MNLPNKLTVARLVMAPMFYIAFSLPEWVGPSVYQVSAILLLVLFACIELTDLLDGKIARGRNMVTDLGKVMDPFADTFSRLTYFVCLMHAGIMPVYAFMIIMWREFAQAFLRSLMMREGVAMPANIWGKSKAVLYAVVAVLGVLYLTLFRLGPQIAWLPVAFTVLQVLFALAAIASLASFATYLSGAIKSGALSHMSR